jgi:hypothetical protein
VTPGERVTLIRQLAEELAKSSFTDGDLSLRQFGFRWHNQWNGDAYSYYVEMLETGDDVKLLELHKHIFGFSGEPASSELPDYWGKRGLRVFISHLAINKEFATQLKSALSDYGIAAFVAHEDIEPTREWQDEIERGLATCDALVVLLSPGFKESNWTDQEVGFCHGRRILIVSVRQGVDPYGFISRYQAVRGSSRSAVEVASDLFRLFIRNPKTAAATAESLVAAFEDSNSFADAKHRVNQLSNIVSWTPELLRRIDTAVRENDQVSHSWGVPGQVAQILGANGGEARPPNLTSSVTEANMNDLPF